MKHTNKLYFITYCAAFCAVGVLLPTVFHMFGAVSGQTFLPMHIPVLMAGLLVSPCCGLIVGAVSPVISCILTNMPALQKMPFMCLELAAYGVFSGIFMRLYQKKFKSEMVSLYLSLVSAQIVGRAVNLACTFAAIRLFGVTSPAVSVGAVLMSVPAGFTGLVIQWILIPPAVRILMKIKHV